MPFATLLFDLFRTVVVYDPAAPTGKVHEPQWRDAMRAQSAALVAACPGLSVEPFLDALIEASDEIARARPPEYRETPIADRYRRALDKLSLEVADRDAAARRLAAVQLRAQMEHTHVPREHHDLLRDLGAHHRLGLVSNFDDAPSARAMLARHGIDRHFQTIVLSIEVNRRKPHAEIFALALRDLGASPGEALFVGDSLRADIGGAAAAGLATAWINRKGVARGADSPTPTYELATLSALREVL